jgi:FkbM family methyltransferase
MLLFGSGWPIFRLFDRLASKSTVNVSLSPTAVTRSYVAHLFPFHEKVSDYVRACSQPYCDQVFIELLLVVGRYYDKSQPIWLLEVGANLGDCALWAMGELGPQRLRVLAFEPMAEAVDLLRQAVRSNGWEMSLQVAEAAVMAKPGTVELLTVGARIGNPFAQASTSTPKDVGEDDAYSGFHTAKAGTAGVPTRRVVPATSVDASVPAELLGPDPPPVVLKIVVFNATLEVLDGAKALLSNPSRAVVAMSVLLLRDYADDLGAQVRELWSLFPGYVVRVPKFSNSPASLDDVLAYVHHPGDDYGAFTLVAHLPLISAAYDSWPEPPADEPKSPVPATCVIEHTLRQTQNRLSGTRGKETYFL